MRWIRWSTFLLLAVLTVGCGVHKETVSSGAGWLSKQVGHMDGLQEHQWGFALYDPAEEKWLYRRRSDQYYTPASNTKILTFYTALKHLGDTTQALRYVERGDTLIFWGTGDPSLMYTVADSNQVVQFIKAHPAATICYAPLEPVAKYGPGWAWDDFAYNYQVERSTLPVYGNRLTFSKLALELPGTVTPAYFKDYVVEDPLLTSFTSRLPEANAFSINSALINELPFERSIPFVVSDYDVAAILSDLTSREIVLKYDFEHPEVSNVVKGSPTDSLFTLLMRDSDNFVAEQLMIQVADHLGLELGVDTVIRHMQKTAFSGAPQEFQWFDGSGLSRYNLCTPESLVWVLEMLYAEFPFDYLKAIFPGGGKNGTIEDRYGLPGEETFVYAKTGTLRNRHCLSGFVVTESSKVLIFSFMHSNFVGSSTHVKREMEKLLIAIREKY